MNLTSVIDNYCGHDEKIMDENANKDSKVFATQRDLLAGAISKEYALRMDTLPRPRLRTQRLRGPVQLHAN